MQKIIIVNPFQSLDLTFRTETETIVCTLLKVNTIPPFRRTFMKGNVIIVFAFISLRFSGRVDEPAQGTNGGHLLSPFDNLFVV